MGKIPGCPSRARGPESLGPRLMGGRAQRGSGEAGSPVSSRRAEVRAGAARIGPPRANGQLLQVLLKPVSSPLELHLKALP